jgi:hypothetical protein
VLAVFDDIIKAKDAEAPPCVISDSGSSVQVIEALNDGDWLNSKWAIDARKKKESASASAAGVSTATVESGPGAHAAAASAPLPSRPALPALLQRMGLKAFQPKSSSAPVFEPPSLPAADATSPASSAASAIRQLARRSMQHNRQQSASLSAASEALPAVEAVTGAPSVSQPNACTSLQASSKSAGGWSKLQSKVFQKSSASGIASTSDQAALQTAVSAFKQMLPKTTLSVRVSGSVNSSAASLPANTLGQDTYVLPFAHCIFVTSCAGTCCTA